MQGKQCSRCKQTLPITSFRWLHKSHRGKQEHHRDSWCVSCRADYKRTPTQHALANARAKARRTTDPEYREDQRVRSEAYYAQNKPQILEKARLKGKAGGWLDKRLKAKFGIGLDEYERLRDAQRNCCKLCGQHERTRQRRLAVDHCHTSKRVRGLLCHHCNTGLGNFRDDPELLRRAIEYLSDADARSDDALDGADREVHERYDP